MAQKSWLSAALPGSQGCLPLQAPDARREITWWMKTSSSPTAAAASPTMFPAKSIRWTPCAPRPTGPCAPPEYFEHKACIP